MSNQLSNLPDLTAINAYLTALSLPTYNDVVNALCDVLDGDPDHHIISDSGLDAKSAQHVVDTRAAVRPLWLATLK